MMDDRNAFARAEAAYLSPPDVDELPIDEIEKEWIKAIDVRDIARGLFDTLADAYGVPLTWRAPIVDALATVLEQYIGRDLATLGGELDVMLCYKDFEQQWIEEHNDPEYGYDPDAARDLREDR